MKIVLAQMQVEAGKPQQNVERLIAAIQKASEAGAELVCAPEMCIGGYLLGDLWLDDDYCLDLMTYNSQISDAAKKYSIAVSFGNIYLETDINKRLGIEGHHPNHDGRLRRYNAVYVFDKNGEPARRIFDNDSMLPKGVEIKTNLPNYRIFDDERYFFSKLDHCLDFGIPQDTAYVPFEINGTYVGMALCEDLWCEDYRLNGDSINPTLWLVENNADIVVNASASPWTFGKNGARDRRTEYVYSEIRNRSYPAHRSSFKPTFLVHDAVMLYVNCIGIQNNGKNLVIFDGGSTVYNKDGKACVYDEQYSEMVMLADTKNLPVPFPRNEKPKIAQKYRGIKWAIQQFLGKTPIVNGVSGGIDSAVTTALYADALGKEQVIGVNMPSKHNKDITKSAAQKLCNNLGIRYHVVPIEELAEATRSTLIKYQVSRSKFPDVHEDLTLPQLVDENLQAKTRAISILSNIAQIEGGVYSCNGNKVELAIGYFTLDADGRGAINPLGDLTKEEVYELGHYLNKEIFHSEMIPSEILDPEIIVPSAELANGQYDPIKVGYHCRILEKMTNYKISSATTFMEHWIDGDLHTYLDIPLTMMEKYGMTDGEAFIKDLTWFLSREKNQVFKRVQSVPIIMLSKTSYGYDRRESILPSFSLTKRAKYLSGLIEKLTYSPSV